jgi:tetratricopeptide (TPR) repeat protein
MFTKHSYPPSVHVRYADKVRAAGNDLVRAGRHAAGRDAYLKALRLLEAPHLRDLVEEEMEREAEAEAEAEAAAEMDKEEDQGAAEGTSRGQGGDGAGADERAPAPRPGSAARAVLDQLTALWLNLALCDMRLGDYRRSVTWSDKALEADPGAAKAHFRRAQALARWVERRPRVFRISRAAFFSFSFFFFFLLLRFYWPIITSFQYFNSLCEYGEAEASLRRALARDPSLEPEAAALRQRVREQRARAKSAEKKIAGKIFS